ncbi:hypothetical protein ACTMU2_07780 [Cupriavidus basilensis]
MENTLFCRLFGPEFLVVSQVQVVVSAFPSRQYCPVLLTESGCLLGNQTGEICGGEWDSKNDLWRVGTDNKAGDSTDAMIKPEFKKAKGVMDGFFQFRKRREVKYGLGDRIDWNLGAGNLVACDPLTQENVGVYILIANQLKAEEAGR